MTNPSKAWAMLTARGAQIGGAGGGGIPTFTQAEVARLLKGLRQGPFLAGMVKESGDTASLGPLERWLWVETLAMADPVDKQGERIRELAWPDSHGQAYCRRLAGLAVLEFVVPRPELCERCNGRGWIKRDGQGVYCDNCGSSENGSTGGQPLSPAMRAELAGIPLRSWKDGWDRRYELVHATVWSWHTIALSHLRRSLERLAELPG